MPDHVTAVTENEIVRKHYMNQKISGTMFRLLVTALTVISVLRPLPVYAESIYKEHEITPVQKSEQKVYRLDESVMTFAVPSDWTAGTVNDKNVFYPDSSNKDEYVLVELMGNDPALRMFREKDVIDSWIRYLMKEEPQATETEVSHVSTEYWMLSGHYFTKTSLDRKLTTKEGTSEQKELCYCLPVAKDNVLILTVVLKDGAEQKFAEEEEAVLLSVVYDEKNHFEAYLMNLDVPEETAVTEETEPEETAAPAETEASEEETEEKAEEAKPVVKTWEGVRREKAEK
jgi:hypothetical protein